MSRTRREYLAATAGVSAGLAGCLGGVTGSGGGSTENCSAAKEGTVDELATPVVGDPEASVTVKAFEDFACPHCRDYSLNVFPQIRSEFVDPGKIRYEFHDFPIPVSRKWSWAAASAARAVQDATDASTFFDYTHSLFENQDGYSMSTVADLADGTGATPCAVRAAAENGTYRPVVKADRQAGIDAGVEATPTVFVNGTKVDHSFSAIKSEIESNL